MEFVSAYNGVLTRYGLYLLIFWPTIGYHVYTESKNRGLSKPRTRGLVLGFLGVPGLLIHLWYIRSHE